MILQSFRIARSTRKQIVGVGTLVGLGRQIKRFVLLLTACSAITMNKNQSLVSLYISYALRATHMFESSDYSGMRPF